MVASAGAELGNRGVLEVGWGESIGNCKGLIEGQIRLIGPIECLAWCAYVAGGQGRLVHCVNFCGVWASRLVVELPGGQHGHAYTEEEARAEEERRA